MPLLCDYCFSLEDNLLKVTSNKEQLSANNQHLMQLMIELYNCTNKIAAWQAVHPLLSMKDFPELINYLYQNTNHNHKLTKHKLMFDQGKWSELTLQSFIGSRELNFSKEFLATGGIDIQNNEEKGLLTIIDLLNHKYGENGYIPNEQTASLHIKNKPDPQNQEVFVHYNKLDPLLSYLLYGFVDTNSPILHSVPLRIKCLSGLVLIIQGAVGRAQEEIIEMAPHLQEYLPTGFMREGNCIIVRNVIIPNLSAKNTLHEVMKLILLDCDNEHIYQNEEMIEQELSSIKKQLCLGNLKYWQDFSALLKLKKFDSLPTQPKNDLNALITFSTDQIKNYMKANQVTIF
jgi:hypothetical protein